MEVPGDRISSYFAVYKDANFDRMVMDPRGVNRTEFGLSFWTCLLASTEALLRMTLRPDEILTVYSEDIVQFYEQFVVSPARTKRNAFIGEWDVSEVDTLACVKGWSSDQPLLFGFNSMAIGDLNSVEFAMCPHLVLAY